MSFKDIVFPHVLSYGSSGGPSYNTSIVTVKSGREKRNINWEYPRIEFDVSTAIQEMDDLESLIAFFHIAQGRGYSFRFKDWSDYKSCKTGETPTEFDQALVTIDGTKYLAKHYQYGGESKTRLITKPVPGTVLLNDPPDAEAPSGVNYTTGIVTGDATSAGFEFDIQARFDTDSISTNLENYQLGSVEVPIIEVR